MKKIVECVPNFSEGRDMNIIRQITDAICSVEGITLLDVDPGKATNRTVVTFVGEPEDVIEAAFRGIQMAALLIDMTQHSGEHPRMGATDVCPLIPISGLTMEEAIYWANQLAERVGKELYIPVFLYEYAAIKPEHRSLSVIRAGEYEGMAKKLATDDFIPDYGPRQLNESAGVTAIGARDFLIAYNVNLNTTSVRRANSVAFDVREAGRVKTDSEGKVVKDELGNTVRVPGQLREVAAIGWFIEEYGIAQVSMNLKNIHVTPLHLAFEACDESARKRGLRVTGSELIGLVPLQPMLEAGRHFLYKQHRSAGVSDAELIKMAVKTMGLDELCPFDPQKKIIEYVLDASKGKKLVQQTLQSFAEETASESPAPGGGSVAAYLGALAAALGTMVANLSATKKGWEAQTTLFSIQAEQGQALLRRLLLLVDRDTQAFNEVMNAIRLPKKTDEDRALRQTAMEAANRQAMLIPLQVMEAAAACFPLLRMVATEGNPASISDAGVGALCARSAVWGAWLNVRINASGLKDRAFAEEVLAKGEQLLQHAIIEEQSILAIVEPKL